MKVVMTQGELTKMVRQFNTEMSLDDAPIRPFSNSPTSWAIYLSMRHWDMYIPIHIEEERHA